MTPTTADLAWAAGFFDGEGCITYRVNTNSLSVRAAQKVRNPLVLLQGWFGGTIVMDKGVEIESWIATGPTALRFLELVGPFLRRKTMHYELVMAWARERAARVAAGRKYKTRTPDEWRYDRWFEDSLKYLNQYKGLFAPLLVLHPARLDPEVRARLEKTPYQPRLRSVRR